MVDFDSTFFLANFLIIGTALGLGIGLWPVFSRENKDIARKISQVWCKYANVCLIVHKNV